MAVLATVRADPVQVVHLTLWAGARVTWKI